MDLGKLKLLFVDGPALDAEYFTNIDAVLLEIAAIQEKKLLGLEMRTGSGRNEHTAPGNDDSTNTSQPGVSSPLGNTAASNRKPKTTVKVNCSVPYNQSDRQVVIRGAVDFIRQQASKTKQQQQHQAAAVRNILTTPSSIPARTPKATTTTATTTSGIRIPFVRGPVSPVRVDVNINTQIDAELIDIKSLRTQRQWRVTLMEKMERTSRVNEANYQSHFQDSQGEEEDEEEGMDGMTIAKEQRRRGKGAGNVRDLMMLADEQ